MTGNPRIDNNGEFPVIPEITPSHVFTKEINHAATRNQYFNGNLYCKTYLRVFSVITGNPVVIQHTSIKQTQHQH